MPQYLPRFYFNCLLLDCMISLFFFSYGRVKAWERGHVSNGLFHLPVLFFFKLAHLKDQVSECILEGFIWRV